MNYCLRMMVRLCPALLWKCGQESLSCVVRYVNFQLPIDPRSCGGPRRWQPFQQTSAPRACKLPDDTIEGAIEPTSLGKAVYFQKHDAHKRRTCFGREARGRNRADQQLQHVVQPLPMLQLRGLQLRPASFPVMQSAH